LGGLSAREVVRMAFISSFDISGSALSVQRLRADIISQNISNQATYNTAVGEDPYCRQLVVVSEKKSFKDVLGKYMLNSESQSSKGVYYRAGGDRRYRNSGVAAVAVIEDDAPFVPVYEPDNPLADEEGYIYYPNVDNTKEQTDLLAAQQAYNASLSALTAVSAMIQKAMSISGR